MDTAAYFMPALVVGGLLLAGWICLPDVLFLLRLTHVQRGMAGGPESVPLDLPTEIPGETSEDLANHGFVPIGKYWESLPAHKVFYEHVFAAKEGDCFAAVSKLFDNDKPRLSFLTRFTNGAVILTQNYSGGLQAESATLIAGPPHSDQVACPEPDPEVTETALSWKHLLLIALIVGLLVVLFRSESQYRFFAIGGLVLGALALAGSFVKVQPGQCSGSAAVDDRTSVADVLEEHRQRIDLFVGQAFTPGPCRTDEDFLEAQRVFYEQPDVNRQFRGTVLFLLVAKAIMLSAGPAIGGWFLGFTHPGPWLILLGEGLFVVLFRKFGYPLLRGMDSHCDQPGTA